MFNLDRDGYDWYREDEDPPEDPEPDDQPAPFATSDAGWFGGGKQHSWGYEWYSRTGALTDSRPEEEDVKVKKHDRKKGRRWFG